MRYKLKELIDDATNLVNDIKDGVNTSLTFGKTATELNDVISFVGNAIYGYFYDDVVAYEGEDEEEVGEVFLARLCYDINIKIPYWARKYEYVKKLLTSSELSLFQTSKMTSNSTDRTDSAGGTLQKTATTPTGVSTGTAEDGFELAIDSDSQTSVTDIETTGFVDKYTNAQQKFSNATKVIGAREGYILREGSIDELVKVLEKLPSSFADEITKEVSKHFIFVYDR